MASKLKSFVDGSECVQRHEGKRIGRGKEREHFAVGLFDGSAVVVAVVVATTLTSVLRLTFAVSHFCNNSTTSLALPLPLSYIACSLCLYATGWKVEVHPGGQCVVLELCWLTGG